MWSVSLWDLISAVGWDRVHTSGMPWMTLAQAPDGEPRAANETVHFDRFDGVPGTGGMESAAIAEHGTHQDLVYPDQGFDDVAHLLLILCQ